MEKKILRVKPLNSMSMVIGGLTSFATAFYKDKFPSGYFKKVYISDSLNANLYRKNLFTQKNNPYLAIQPIFDMDDTYLEQFSSFEKNSYIIYNNNRLFERTVLWDEERGIKIYEIPTRIKVGYNTTVKVQTAMEAYNVMNYMTSEMDLKNNHYFMNNIAIETEIPKTILTNLCSLLDLDYYNKDDRERMENYLKKYSNNTIYPIVNLATGNQAYVYKFYNNILFNFEGKPTKENNYKNKLIDNCYIKQNFNCEIWSPSTYIMEFTKYDFTAPSPVKDEYELRNMKFNLVINTDYVPNTYEGMNMITKGKFVTDVNTEVDELDLTTILSSELVYIIKLLSKNEIDISKILETHLYINGTKIFKENYKLDYKELKLYTINPIENQVYDIFIYCNLTKLTAIKELIENNHEYLLDKDNTYLDNIINNNYKLLTNDDQVLIDEINDILIN